MDAYQIRTKPDPYEPFNLAQAYRVENIIYMSGQVALTLEGEVVGADDFETQVRQAFDNIRAVLSQEGSDLDRIFKTTVYLTDMANSEKYFEIRNSLIGVPYPAETMVQVSALALPELMIEIDAMALAKSTLRPPLP